MGMAIDAAHRGAVELATETMKEVRFQDIGRVGYKEAWDFQTQLFEETVAQKLVNRKIPEQAKETTDHLIFVEHPPSLPLGRAGRRTICWWTRRA